MLSIVIPALNEAERIGETIARARHAAPAAEILVVDGGSQDGTLLHLPPGVIALTTEPGRGRQLNAGAFAASGDILLFLHADTLLPVAPVELAIESALQDSRRIGGNFRLEFRPCCAEGRFLEWGSRLLRRCGVFYGDSAIFVRREPFLDRGGFRKRQIMEDVDLVRWMGRTGRTVELPLVVTTSTRRFQGRLGLYLPLWAGLQLLNLLGAPDSILARIYSRVGRPGRSEPG